MYIHVCTYPRYEQRDEVLFLVPFDKPAQRCLWRSTKQSATFGLRKICVHVCDCERVCM